MRQNTDPFSHNVNKYPINRKKVKEGFILAHNAETTELGLLTTLCLVPCTVAWGIMVWGNALEQSGSSHDRPEKVGRERIDQGRAISFTGIFSQ